MPKYHREKFQHATMNPIEVLAYRIACKFKEYHPADAPPLKWCTVAALFAIHGEHTELHDVYPEWLKESFLKHRDWTIAALDFSRKELDKLMFKKSGEPNVMNHAFIAACYAGRDHYRSMQLGAPLETDSIKNAALKYGFVIVRDDANADTATKEADTLKNAAKIYDEWHNKWDAFRDSEDGQFFGEV